MTFMWLEGQVASYGTHSKELKAMGVDLEDWIGYDGDTKKMKLDIAMKKR